MTVWSRRASRQMSHSSDSVRLKQRRHGRMRSLTSRRASASARASSGRPRTTWKAILCALLGPMEGSLESSVIRRSTGLAYVAKEPLKPRYVQPEVTEAPGDPAEALGGELLDAGQGLVDGGEHQVLERLDVLGVQNLRVYLQLDEVEAPGHRRLDGPAASAGRNGLFGQVLLRLLHFRLHLLYLLHHLVDV